VWAGVSGNIGGKVPCKHVKKSGKRVKKTRQNKLNKKAFRKANSAIPTRTKDGRSGALKKRTERGDASQGKKQEFVTWGGRAEASLSDRRKIHEHLRKKQHSKKSRC